MFLSETLPLETRLSLALIAYSPAHVAGCFGRMVGQFYDRESFDGLARAAAALYDKHSARNAARFRGRLDQLLAERDEQPIDWRPEDGP